MAPTSSNRHQVNGRARMASTQRATMNSVIVAVVRASTCDTSCERASP
jgi:hypothetical protein